MDSFLLMSVLIVGQFLYRGVLFRFTALPFKDRRGLNLPSTLMSAEAWREAHRFAGLLCLLFGGLAAALDVGYYFLFRDSSVYFWGTFILKALCLLALVPLVKRRVSRLFDSTGRRIH